MMKVNNTEFYEVWLDTTNCTHDSDFAASTGAYKKTSQEWTMNHDGDLIDGIG
jgi:hypothetical protein